MPCHSCSSACKRKGNQVHDQWPACLPLTLACMSCQSRLSWQALLIKQYSAVAAGGNVKGTYSASYNGPEGQKSTIATYDNGNVDQINDNNGDVSRFTGKVPGEQPPAPHASITNISVLAWHGSVHEHSSHACACACMHACLNHQAWG